MLAYFELFTKIIGWSALAAAASRRRRRTP